MGQRLMMGVIWAIAMLASGGTPEVPAAGGVAQKERAAPIAAAIDLGRKWGIVTSVRRTPERNRAVGGALNSFHLHGRAIDIARRPGVRHVEIETAFRRAGYALIESLDEGDHSHFAFGPSRGGQAAPVLAQAWSAPPAPQAPPRERLAADDHGTLVIDLPAPAAAAIGSN